LGLPALRPVQQKGGDGGKTWQKFVSGYHHNVAYDFLSLRPALYVAGTDEARFCNLVYRALAWATEQKAGC